MYCAFLFSLCERSKVANALLTQNAHIHAQCLLDNIDKVGRKRNKNAGSFPQVFKRHFAHFLFVRHMRHETQVVRHMNK